MSSTRARSLTEPNLLSQLDYSVLQQCIHCGMCLPTCPTYDATKDETSSPRGRIALMRAVADGKLAANSTQFAHEMYFCLGCLACETACPAGVNYAEMIEFARAEVESNGAKTSASRNFIRAVALRWLFAKRDDYASLQGFCVLIKPSACRAQSLGCFQSSYVNCTRFNQRFATSSRST